MSNHSSSSKQQLLLEYLLSSPDTFALCKGIIKPEYFNPEFRQAVEFVDMYYEKFNSTPPLKILKAEFGLELSKHHTTKDEVEYCSSEVEKFCQYKAAETAVIKASKLLKEGKVDQIEALIHEAAAVSLTKDLGCNYFSDTRQRLERMSQQPHRISTGWLTFDKLLGGGLARTELLLVSANSGGGKSITLANLALNHVKLKYNVLYISLELSEDLVQQRFDTMISSIPSVIWQSNQDKIVSAVEYLGANAGELTVVRLPTGTNANKIKAYLKEFELKKGYIPDTIIIDYLDCMGTNSYVPPGNISEKDRQATEELRDLLETYNCMGATASQQNRCLSLDSIIITPDGNKQIKDVKIGDKLFNGTVYNTVTEILPITTQYCYKIMVTSGQHIICSANHKFPTPIGLSTINTGIKVGSLLFTLSGLEPIISIESIGKIETIDINLDGDRLFLANNVLTHNSAIDAEELNQSHIAGGLTKVNTSDWYFSIVLNPAMKARGDIIFVCLKSRSSDAVGQQILLDWNNVALTISDKHDDSDKYNKELSKFENTAPDNKSKRLSLLDVMDI